MIHNEHHEHERALRPYRIMLHQHLPVIQNEIPTIYIHSLLHFKDVPILERFSLRRNSSSTKGLISASRPPKMALKAQTISLVNLIGIWIYIYIYTGIWIYRYWSIYLYIYIYIYIYISIYLHIYRYRSISIPIDLYLYPYLYLYMHIWTCRYIKVFVATNMYMYFHINQLSRLEGFDCRWWGVRRSARQAARKRATFWAISQCSGDRRGTKMESRVERAWLWLSGDQTISAVFYFAEAKVPTSLLVVKTLGQGQIVAVFTAHLRSVLLSFCQALKP